MKHGNDKWVALLRGVNVGGHNKVPMADFRALGQSLGWRDVRSYIASGNLVFDAHGDQDSLARVLKAGLREKLGVEVPVLVASADEVLAALDACPWNTTGNLIHLFWCWDDPDLNTDLFEALRASGEELHVQGRWGWFFAPQGVARSKLMAQMETALNVVATARNLNTIRKLADMLRT